jgi:uncharacterized protein involved in exopolysaccharide biosynthesis
MVMLAGVLLVAGCATGKNYQGDIDSLNARVSSLQSELSVKDQEIARLQSQAGDQQSALAQAEAQKRLLDEKLNDALAKLEAQSRKQEAASTSQEEESDLK